VHPGPSETRPGSPFAGAAVAKPPNFHRPCAQPELSSDAKGKQKRIYRHYQTPWETFQKLPKASQYLKPGQTVGALQRLAKAASDTAAARQMQQAKGKLFASFVGAKTAP
jgi:hypothetical protein